MHALCIPEADNQHAVGEHQRRGASDAQRLLELDGRVDRFPGSYFSKRGELFACEGLIKQFERSGREDYPCLVIGSAMHLQRIHLDANRQVRFHNNESFELPVDSFAIPAVRVGKYEQVFFAVAVAHNDGILDRDPVQLLF